MAEDNVLQGHLIQMLKVLVAQSSKKILKVVFFLVHIFILFIFLIFLFSIQMILKKIKSFMNEKSFDKRSGAIVGSFCGFLTTSVTKFSHQHFLLINFHSFK